MSTRRILFLALGALLAYATALAATLPSAWIAHEVQRRSDGLLELRDPAGTAWSGSGRLFARPSSGPLIDLGALRWTASASGLLRLRLRANVLHGSSAIPMLLELSPWSVAAQRVQVEFPGTALTAFAPALATIGPEGTIHVRSDSLRMEHGSLLGLADVEWRRVQLAGFQGLQLGSHIARLRGGGEKVDIDVSTLDGPLLVRAKGSWDRTTGLALSGTAEPRTQSLVPFLRGFCAGYRDSVCQFAYGPGKGVAAPTKKMP